MFGMLESEHKLIQSVDGYLADLNLPKIVLERVNEVLSSFQFLCRAPVDRVFVSDSIDESTNERRYESVWGFSGPYWMEARNFLRQFDVDIASYADSIHYLGVQYDSIRFPDQVSDSSRLSIEVGTAKVNYSLLSAIGMNCVSLISIIDDLLIPSLIGPLGELVSNKPS